MRSQQRADALERLGELFAANAKDGSRVRAKLAEWSGELARSGGNRQVTVEHEEECPRRVDALADCECEGRAIDYSDRTGEQAARGRDVFEHARRVYDQAQADADRHLSAALDLMRKADRVRMMATSSVPNEDEATPCASHARFTNTATGAPWFEPARPGRSLCRFCDDKQREHGIWPPVAVLEMRARGQVVSQLAWERAVRAERARMSA